MAHSDSVLLLLSLVLLMIIQLMSQSDLRSVGIANTRQQLRVCEVSVTAEEPYRLPIHRIAEPN